MPSLKPADESFFESAPQLFSHTWEIDQPADAVWSQLVGDKPLYWIRGLNIRWTSPAPFGVGSTRVASVAGLLRVKEHFFLWEEGRRYAFYGAAMNLPLFNRLAEDYIVEPRGESSCAFTWKVAIEPSLLGRPGASANVFTFAQAFRDTGKHFRAA
jgi:hypothetical protein